MPTTKPSRTDDIRDALAQLTDSGDWPSVLTNNDDFPLSLRLTDPDNSQQRWSALFSWAKAGSDPMHRPSDEYETEFVRITDTEETTALFRISGGIVVQVADQGKSNRANSVWPRAGVITLLVNLLNEQSELTPEISIADLGRYLATPNAWDAKERQLRRMDEGNRVTEADVRAIADVFSLKLNDLCFAYDARLYEKKAYEMRKKSQGPRISSSAKITLKPVKIDVYKFGDTHGPIDMLRSVGRIETQNLQKSVAELIISASSAFRRFHAMQDEPEAKRDAAIIELVGALTQLDSAGVTAWIATYRDKVPIPADDEILEHFPDAQTYAEQVAVIIFTSGTSSPPKFEPQLTATGPTPEEIKHRLT
ncbi:MAG: hypothetical protein H6883_11640 [Rhodobiaceae bacterium]|nr:hypothetical protein [Rhodobiaceae bacterium]